MAQRRTTGSDAAPWERARPAAKKPTRKTTLDPEHKAKAKAAARRAGRPYPNLVDNMREAAAQKAEARARKAVTRKR